MLEGRNYDPLQTANGNVATPSVVTVNTSGTTAVDVNFTGDSSLLGNSPACTITAVAVIALDTTAGNITLKNGASTVATVAKGTTAGGLVGATSLSNTSVDNGATLSVVSSSAGNATVLVYYQSNVELN